MFPKNGEFEGPLQNPWIFKSICIGFIFKNFVFLKKVSKGPSFKNRGFLRK